MNILRKGLSVLLTLAMVLTMVPVYAVPETVEPQEEVIPHKTEVPEGYKGIYSKADLNNVRNDLGGKYILMCDLVFTDADYNESGAYYNDGQLWEPIGASAETPFAGVFDGNNYVIRNLQVHSWDDQAMWNYAGLFGYNAGTIHNLGMEDGKIVAEEAAWAACAGAIAGENSGTIRDCFNTGMVYAKMTATEDAGYRFALAAGIAGRSDKGIIDSCWNSGTVFAEALDIAMYPIARAAGIVAESERSEILRCTNTGYIRAEGVYSDGELCAWAAGIAGSALYDGNLISQCSNLGAVDGNGDKTGGIAGYNSGAIENCYNAGRIHRCGYGDYPGGIVGVNEGTLNCCYNVGEAKVYDSQYWRPTIGLVSISRAGSYQNCYYPDSFDYGIFKHYDSSGKPLDVTNLYIGTALSDEEMRQQAAYKGFDFANIWTLEEDGAYPYPVLKNVAKIRNDTRNFAGGRGTQDDPYRIATAEHLNNMRKYISAYYVLVDDITFADGQLFDPICMQENTPFVGSLDGAGHTIENLQIAVSKADGGQLYVGMFGYLAGTVKNLELKGGYVRADVASKTYCDVFVGALAGNADGAQIENVVTSCQVDAVATITEFLVSHYAFAGGIVGKGGTLRSCLNSGQVTALAVLDIQYAPTHAYTYAGGIAARDAQIENCTNTGAVLAQVHAKTLEVHPDYWYYGSHQDAYAGGIVANTNFPVSGCSNLGSVDARSTYEAYCDMPSTYAGGIVASYELNYGDLLETGITNCTNAGTVTATDGTGYAGGIACKVASDDIQFCCNSGAVTASTYAGGIVCESGSGTLSWCRNVARVSGAHAAGIVYNAKGLTISCSSNEGAVMAQQSLAGILRTGGNNVVENCYNAGKLVAMTEKSYGYGIASGATVRNCYNVGLVTGSKRWAYGISDGESENCYYIDAYEEEEGSTAVRCTAEQLQNQATYAGFDFEEIWTFASEGGYPTFQGETPEVLENTVDFLGGYGTAEHPFLIANATHLNNVRRYLGSYFRLVSNIEFTDADFAAGGQFHNDGAFWLPIGTDKNAPFSGELDGDNFTIYNLKIGKATGDYIGLIGVNWGTVKNLTLAETEILLDTSENFNAKDLYIGGLAGYSEGWLENVKVTGSITVLADCTIVDGGGRYYANFGGVVGAATNSLENCTNTAAITVNVVYQTETDFDASKDQSAGIRTFGGYVTVQVGGVVGSLKNATISNSSNIGAISVTLENSGSAPLSYDHSSTTATVGGVVGYGDAVIMNQCANLKDITIWAKTTSKTQYEYTSGTDITVGGVISSLSYYSTSSVTRCANSGNLNITAITSGNNERLSCSVSAGGVVGEAGSAPITDCYNAGDIATTISAAYNGRGGIGGIAGYTHTDISTCYNIGYLSAEHWSTHKTSSCDIGAITGGIYGEAALTDCYYLDCMSAGTGFGTDTAIAFDYEKMLEKGYYSGFDFNSVWLTNENIEYAFPYLYHVSVLNQKWVVGLVFTKRPNQTQYMQGLEHILDLTGAEVALLYSDGSKEIVNLGDTHTRGFESGQLGEQTVYLTWENYETSFKVTVVEPEAESLEILQLPDRLEFEPGEALDLTGLSIMAHYANGDSGYVFDWEVSEVDIWSTGEKTVTVSCQGATVQFVVIYKWAGPDSVTSDIYTVDNQYVTMVPYGTTVGEFLEGFNETAYLYVFSGATTVSYDTLVGTGMELMLNGAEEIWLTIVVTGDVNGDGKISVTDLLAVKAHLLQKSPLIGAQAKAADVNGQGGITVTDFIQYKSHLLGKDQITPN